MPTPGRPKALDEAKHGNICELVAGGSSIRQAARYYGCAPSSIRREAERNEEFRRQLAMAKAEAHIIPTEVLRYAADKDWRAAVAWIKHVNPDRCGRPNASIVTQREANQFVADLIDSVERAVSKPEERADLFELLAAAMPAAMRRRWDGQTLQRNRKQVLADFEKRRAQQVEQRAKQRREFALEITRYLPQDLILKLNEDTELNEIFETRATPAGTSTLPSQAIAEPRDNTSTDQGPSHDALTNGTLAEEREEGPPTDAATTDDVANDNATNFGPPETNNGPLPGRNAGDISRTKTNNGPPPGQNPNPIAPPLIRNPQCPFDLPPQRGPQTPE